MIVYSATKGQFRVDVIDNDIERVIYDKFQERLGRKTARREVDSWAQSMMYMNNVLQKAEVPDNAGVAIEYQIPQSSKRVDFILTGWDEAGHPTAIIIELKQWSEVDATEKDGVAS